MKKIIGGLLGFASVGLAPPALASSTFVVNQVADLQESWFEPGRSNLWVEAPSLVQIAGQDIVEGTLWFRGGHIRANNPATFYVSGRIHTIGGTVYESPIADVRLLNAKGETFGRTRPGYFDDTQYTGSFAPEEAMPFDVYGIKYRIAFRGIALGWALRSTGLDMSWWMLTNASYAPGDVFTSAVPEPSSWAMMALGFAGLGLAMRRRRAGGVVALA